MKDLTLEPPFRLAVPADGPQLAEFALLASEGLAMVVWRAGAGPNGDPMAYGAARQAKRTADGSIVVIDEGDGAIAELLGYPLGPEPDDLEQIPELFRPLVELENLALDTWYVNILAVTPAQQGRGLGTRLLALAERAARAADRSAVSLIVSDDHVDARRLYVRLGYAEVATRPAVKVGWDGPTETWILMRKDLAPSG